MVETDGVLRCAGEVSGDEGFALAGCDIHEGSGRIVAAMGADGWAALSIMLRQRAPQLPGAEMRPSAAQAGRGRSGHERTTALGRSSRQEGADRARLGHDGGCGGRAP